jgi:hypothetical protein
MSHQKRTKIEDLSANENELFELSEQMMMMIGGGYMGDTVQVKGTEDYINNISKVDEYPDDDGN